MKGNSTAVLKKYGRWWIGWIEEVSGVNCQEATRGGRSLAPPGPAVRPDWHPGAKNATIQG